MRLKEFRYQTKQTKTCVLADQGVFLAKRMDGEFSVHLFEINRFYVEMFYHEEEQFISYIRCFESTDLLKPYLDQIDISEILSVRKCMANG